MTTHPDCTLSGGLLPKTPMAGLGPAVLMRLNITGRNIGNIALNAAVLTAQSGERVRMTHVPHSMRTEYPKLAKSLVAIAIGDHG